MKAKGKGGVGLGVGRRGKDDLEGRGKEGSESAEGLVNGLRDVGRSERSSVSVLGDALDAQRSDLLAEKQEQLEGVFDRHDTLVCGSLIS